MTKRGPNDILTGSVSNGNLSDNGTPHSLYSAEPMSSISLANDAKKLKLDNALQQQLTGLLSVDITKDFSLNSTLNCSAELNLNAEESSALNNGSSLNEDSCVIHIRNLCNDITDGELVSLCSPFGKINNFLLLAQKGQAFVEFENKTSARLLVTVSQTSPIILKNRTVVCQYSNHRQLKTFHNNGSKISAMYAGSSALPGMNNGCDTTGILASQTQQQPNAVLRVIIENMLYPVTLDILYQIFSRFGKVLRIITFTKNNTFQALIQFSDASSSQMAKTALDGISVYNGCCTLRIDYSKLSTLNVKYNNEKSRDYTNPNLPSGDLDHALGFNLAQYLGSSSGGLSAASQLTTAPFTCAAPFTAPSALPQTLQAAAAAGGFSIPAFTLAAAAAANSQLASVAGLRLSSAQFSALALSPVVLVSNLNEQKVTPDALFTLFGVYGDVQRVKVLYNKKDNALIQYAEPAQAQLAIQHLDKIKLWGKTIRVTASKHMNVQMPKEGQSQDAGLTKDYSQSSLHRFKKPGSKNFMNIYPPSSTLHLSNIPAGVGEDFLINAFNEAGFTIKAFKFFPKDHKMALMQMDSVEEALSALMAMHNFRLAENAHLRVSFSKSGV